MSARECIRCQPQCMAPAQATREPRATADDSHGQCCTALLPVLGWPGQCGTQGWGIPTADKPE